MLDDHSRRQYCLASKRHFSCPTVRHELISWYVWIPNSTPFPDFVSGRRPRYIMEYAPAVPWSVVIRRRRCNSRYHHHHHHLQQQQQQHVGIPSASSRTIQSRTENAGHKMQDNTESAAKRDTNFLFNFPVVLLFLRTTVALRVQKDPRRLLRKTSNLFLFNYEPERIDHGDVKDSNFEDNRQPEIAIWPPKPEVLISPGVR